MGGRSASNCQFPVMTLFGKTRPWRCASQTALSVSGRASPSGISGASGDWALTWRSISAFGRCPQEGRETHPPSPLPCARSAWEGGSVLARFPGRRPACAALWRALGLGWCPLPLRGRRVPRYARAELGSRQCLDAPGVTCAHRINGRLFVRTLSSCKTGICVSNPGGILLPLFIAAG